MKRILIITLAIVWLAGGASAASIALAHGPVAAAGHFALQNGTCTGNGDGSGDGCDGACGGDGTCDGDCSGTCDGNCDGTCDGSGGNGTCDGSGSGCGGNGQGNGGGCGGNLTVLDFVSNIILNALRLR